jgi:5-methylcytosine-specific restriction endonuclease McrA
MRRIYRDELPLTLRAALYRREKAATASGEVREQWKGFRASRPGRDVASCLATMAGKRVRCFFCSDSLGADIDHFKPLAVYPEVAFRWMNHLLVCPPCNRAKGTRFPVDEAGRAVLIDPTSVDPWRFLFLDTETAVIAERYSPSGPDERGLVTLDVIRPINFESAIEGRTRAIRRLRTAAANLLASLATSTESRDLWDEIAADDFGVARWFAAWDGADEEPFSTLRVSYPARWRRFVKLSLRRY